MPIRIPSQTRQVGGSLEVQTGRVQSGEDFTGKQIKQAGDAVTSIGVGLRRFGTEMEDELNTARAKDGDSSLFEYARDQRLDYEGKIGLDALPNSSTQSPRELAQANIQKEADRISAGLDNETQRDMFLKSANSRISASSASMGVHEVKQVRAYNIGRSEARAIQFGEDAKESYDPSDTNPLGSKLNHLLALNMMKDEVRAVGKLKGRSPEEIENEVDAATAGLHSETVNRLLGEEDPNGARQYLNEFGDDLTGKSRKALSKSVKAAENSAYAQDRVSGISGDTKGDLQVLRGIAQELRQGKISPERAEAASVAARQRIDAVNVEKDAIRSIAVATIRGSAGSFEQLSGEERDVIIAAGLEKRARNWMAAKATGQPTPAFEKGEAKRVVAHLSNLTPLELRQVFNAKTTKLRHDQIASVVGLDWETHSTPVKGLIDSAYGEDTPEAKVQSLDKEIRQSLMPNIWARAVVGPGLLPRGQGVQNPLNEAVVRGMKELILERTRQDPALSASEVMGQVNDILVKSVMFDGHGVIEGSKIPYPLMKYIDADDAAKATNTSIGIPYADIDINFIDLGDIDGGKSGGMPEHVFDHYAKKQDGFNDMSPEAKSKYALLFARDWVMKGRTHKIPELKALEAIDAKTAGDPDMRISSSITPAPIQAMASLYVDGDTVTIPDFKKFVGATHIPDNMLHVRSMFPGVPSDTLKKEDEYKKLVSHLKAIKKSLEQGKN